MASSIAASYSCFRLKVSDSPRAQAPVPVPTLLPPPQACKPDTTAAAASRDLGGELCMAIARCLQPTAREPQHAVSSPFVGMPHEADENATASTSGSVVLTDTPRVQFVRQFVRTRSKDPHDMGAAAAALCTHNIVVDSPLGSVVGLTAVKAKVLSTPPPRQLGVLVPLHQHNIDGPVMRKVKGRLGSKPLVLWQAYTVDETRQGLRVSCIRTRSEEEELEHTV